MAKDTITVRGTARRRVTPDVATWYAVVEVSGDAQREVYSRCSEALTDLLGRLRAPGVDGGEVSAGTIYVAPRWDDRNRKRVGYVAGGTVTIRGTLAAAAELGQAALDAGALRLDGPVYEIAAIDRVNDELLAEAVAAAATRAAGLAAAAGRSLGPVRTILEGDVTTDGGYGAQARGGVMMEAKMSDATAAPLVPASEELQATVTVTFTLANDG